MEKTVKCRARTPIMDYTSSVISTANKYGVDPNLALAVMQAESGGNAGAVSGAGAIGLFQLMPSTASGLGVNPNDPLQNIDGGIRYLKQQLDAFGGDVTLALAAYNAGPGNVNKYGGVPPFTETQNYISKVLGLFTPSSAVDTSGYGDTSGSDSTGGFTNLFGGSNGSVLPDLSSNEGLIAVGLGLLLVLLIADR